jgi:hypothetical protein
MLRLRALPFVVGIIVAVCAAPAAAATLTVNVGFDDNSPADGLCSLRNAIEAVDSPGSASGDCVPATFAGADPSLGALQDNGGPTQTISLAAGSAAINQIPASGAGCPKTDQHGVPRPSGPACDIGAYEVAPPAAGTGVASTISTSRATVAARVTANAGMTNVEFQYGRATAYGSHTAAQLIGGVTPTTVSATLSG